MNHATDERPLTTADLAAATDPAQRTRAAQQQDLRDSARSIDDNAASTLRDDGQQLAPLFVPQAAEDFRARWDAIQIGFVDDPSRAVRSADELVAQAMKSLAETFARERTELEAQFKEAENTSTETLRIALCRYRSFFQRLLSL